MIDMYIFRWIFRSHIMPKHLNFDINGESEHTYDPAEVYCGHNGWRARLWTFLIRPYLRTIFQFRQFVHLFCVNSGDQIPNSIFDLPTPSFRTIRREKEERDQNVEEDSTDNEECMSGLFDQAE